ncbi:Uu.00g061860.m01.CDS01 [Anthostomella pinea]|uniref:Uu.00g061860.m01.CDS01 n=1 Tax=Anthostomella pinea TaxID=933095 RepID=A0AAI8VSH2_9PEZI|nr:Uu.00g061860.m01.CDS01 [Anthostomella pinea]
MLIEPSSFLGLYERPVTSPNQTLAPATCPPGPDPWFEVWRRRIFPCFPHLKPTAPKHNNSITSTDFYFTTLLPLSPQRQPKSLGMPYTPPSLRSPASSAPPSPDITRRPSFISGTLPPRPALPRSASYLTKHRRTPSATSPVADGSTPDITPPGTSSNLKGMSTTPPSVVRQSPPPISDSDSMPPGAISTPPESSSEDEGTVELEKRGRQIENMQELKEAISGIPQRRGSSPSRTSPGDLLLLPSQAEGLVEEPRKTVLSAALPALNIAARKVSHSRSNTDSNIYLTKSAEVSMTTSDEGSDLDDPPKKPQMVRKKSGELVRPALRPASLRRPSSMPGTPTFGKAVHFDSHLEHVRHFLQVDRPLAVSANSSPAENYESDTEYPFGVDANSGTRSPPHEWEIVVNNFPPETPIRKALPARVERVWMSPDQKCLIGSVAVANLAFQKSVVCRFTFDYWKTTSEVGAEFHHEIIPRETETGYDRFQFSIKLSDLANLESKTLFFCVRYIVNGLEYWDNNNNVNFQVDFRKKVLPQNGKKGLLGASSRPINALPRSHRRSNPSATRRPKSMPAGIMDEFGHDTKLIGFDQPIHEFLGESGPALRLKSSKSTTSIPSDNLSTRLLAPRGEAFSYRYDFGKALGATRKANKEPSPGSDGLYMKPNKKAEVASATNPPPTHAADSQATSAAPEPNGTDSPASASIATSSYEEILNKYCFFNGSKQSSPQMKDGTLPSGRYDGMDEVTTHGTISYTSSSNGSPNMAERPHRGAVHHTLHQNLNPYFQNGYIPVAIGGSPAESPLHSPPSVSRQSFSPSSSTTPTARSSSPASMAGYLPFAGTSADPAPYHVQHLQDRFPFRPDAHTATAIRS